MKKKFLVNSTILIMILIVFGKILGLIRDSLIASNFGLTEKNDIYLFALGTTMLFVSISYGITTTIVPLYSEILNRGSNEDKSGFINNTITVVFVTSIVLVLLGAVFSKYIVLLFAPSLGNNELILKNSVTLIRIMFSSLCFVGIQSIVSGILQSHNRFFAVSSGPIISNLISIFYLAFFINTFDLVGFGISTVLGFLLMFLILVPVYKKLGYKYRFVINLSDPLLKRLFKSLLPIILCSSLAQINIFISRSFAGRLAFGSISSLEYANKINMLVYEIIGQAISMVIYPTLSKFAAEKDDKAFSSEISKGINLILILMLPCAVGLIVLRVPLISLYLQRGKFGLPEVLITSSILVYYIPAMIFYGIRDIINRAFFTLNNSYKAMVNSVICISLNCFFNLILIYYNKVQFIALSNSMALFIATAIYYIQLKKSLQFRTGTTLLEGFIKTVISSILMGFVIRLLSVYITSRVILVMLSVAIGALAYFILMYLFKVKELKYILR